jgi:magnesium transporter
MLSNVPIAKESSSVAEMEKLLNKDIKKFSTINYIYIIDKENKLIGAISIKNLFGSPKKKTAKELIKSDLISVRAETDKERVAMLALEKSLKAVPVTDKNGFLLGIIASDDILKILHDESMENLLRMSGISQEAPYKTNIFSISILKSLKNRLPWLIIGLFGGLLAAFVVSKFEGVLNKNIILASFIPLVVYMSSAVGSQTQAFIIRDLALDHKLNFLKYLTKHTRVIFIIAIIISSLLYLLSLSLYGIYDISLTLSISLFFAIITSIITGLLIPYSFYRLKFDPADASGPISTILQDILSILVYLSIASLLL